LIHDHCGDKKEPSLVIHMCEREWNYWGVKVLDTYNRSLMDLKSQLNQVTRKYIYLWTLIYVDAYGVL